MSLKYIDLHLYKAYEEIYMEPTKILDEQTAAYCIHTTGFNDQQDYGYIDLVHIEFEPTQHPSSIGIILRQWILNNIYRTPYLNHIDEVDNLSRMAIQALGLLKQSKLLWEPDPITIQDILETLIVALRIWASQHDEPRHLIYEFKCLAVDYKRGHLKDLISAVTNYHGMVQVVHNIR